MSHERSVPALVRGYRTRHRLPCVHVADSHEPTLGDVRRAQALQVEVLAEFPGSSTAHSPSIAPGPYGHRILQPIWRDNKHEMEGGCAAPQNYTRRHPSKFDEPPRAPSGVELADRPWSGVALDGVGPIAPRGAHEEGGPLRERVGREEEAKLPDGGGEEHRRRDIGEKVRNVLAVLGKLWGWARHTRGRDGDDLLQLARRLGRVGRGELRDLRGHALDDGGDGIGR